MNTTETQSTFNLPNFYNQAAFAGRTRTGSDVHAGLALMNGTKAPTACTLTTERVSIIGGAGADDVTCPECLTYMGR